MSETPETKRKDAIFSGLGGASLWVDENLNITSSRCGRPNIPIVIPLRWQRTTARVIPQQSSLKEIPYEVVYILDPQDEKCGETRLIFVTSEDEAREAAEVVRNVIAEHVGGEHRGDGAKSDEDDLGA